MTALKIFITENIASAANGITLVLAVVLLLVPVIVASLRGWTYLITSWVTYMGIVAWRFLICLLVPGWLSSFTGSEDVWNHFPDGPGAAATMLTGWIPAAVMTVIVKTIVEFFRRKKSPAS